MHSPLTMGRVKCGFMTLAALSVLLLVSVPPAHGQTETVLYSFQGSPDGADPLGALVLDKEGNLYGVTGEGGARFYGTVFELTPQGTETILHSFGPNGGDGYDPLAGVVRDKKGNLYGTSIYGGAYGGGTVFKLTPSGSETILFSFGANGTDGYSPTAPVVLDKKGNLYGTTAKGGPHGAGTVFKLTRKGSETILHSFDAAIGDGSEPSGGVVLDKEGNLYGTTEFGGAYGCGNGYGCGTVFKLTPKGKETILHSFNNNGTDGFYPLGGVVMDKNGNLYGTTLYGGAYSCFGYGCGTVFELTPPGTETILYSLNRDNGTDGFNPFAGLVRDETGNLYGTTFFGGAYSDGTVFEVTPSGTETILSSFGSNGDGHLPSGGLVLDKKGNLYGTTAKGGAYGYGTVYKVTP